MTGKSIGRCALLFLAGTALQLSTGGADASSLSYPWGVLLAVNYLYILVLLVSFSDKWRFVRSLYDRSAEISSMGAMLALTLIFGLVRQDGSSEGLTGAMGFTAMKSSWIFIVFLFYWMTVTGLKAVDDLKNIRRRKVPTVVMHAAFFVIMASAFFGSGDKMRVKVSAVQGVPVHEGVTASGRTIRLPFSMMLEDFEMDEYPPKVHLARGEGLSRNFVVMERAGDKGSLEGLEIECLDYLEMAGRMPGDSVFVPMNHVGATTALLMKAHNPVSGATTHGWVSCGSHIFEGSALRLPDGGALVMPRREAKGYLSVLEVAGKDGKERIGVGVNSPASVGGWKIYQSGYDSERGRWSTFSVLECVRDGWYNIVQVALWMVLGAGCWIFLTGWKSRKGNREDRP